MKYFNYRKKDFSRFMNTSGNCLCGDNTIQESVKIETKKFSIKSDISSG